MKNSVLTIGNTKIHPGECANLAMPLPERYSCSPQYMPIRIIHGKQAGPCLLLIGTIRGNELNGLEIINKIINIINPNEISGTIITIPVLDILSLTQYHNRDNIKENVIHHFPGKIDGNYYERIAHVLQQEILTKVQYCIELHTGDLNHNILPQIYCDLTNHTTKELAMAFQTPVITNTQQSHSLRQLTYDLSIPVLIYQGGEALKFDSNAINLGVAGITNVLQYLNILPQPYQPTTTPIFSNDEEWLIAPHGGILHTTVTLGQTIKKQEYLGEINDPFGVGIPKHITSPIEGIIAGINTTPLIYEGSKIFKVLSFRDYTKAEHAIEKWDQQQPDSYLQG